MMARFPRMQDAVVVLVSLQVCFAAPFVSAAIVCQDDSTARSHETSLSNVANHQVGPVRKDVRKQIANLAGSNDTAGALVAYDVFVAAAEPDLELLRPVAEAILGRYIPGTSSDLVRIDALERLAGSGDDEARQALKALARRAAATRAGLAPLVALVRVGEREAEVALGALLARVRSNEQTEVLRALKEANARSQASKVEALLSNPLPEIRSAAADVLGSIGTSEQLPALRKALDDEAAVVRTFAAAALKRLGDPAGDLILSGLRLSGVPDLRALLASAYENSDSKQWMQWVRPLLSEGRLTVRLRVAEAMARQGDGAALGVILAMLDDQDPMVRAETARVFERLPQPDPKVVRRLFDDGSDVVRVCAAGAVLRLAGSAVEEVTRR